VTNDNAINGSVVARKFVQGGKVHLGTFDGITITSVPEPGTVEASQREMFGET
jgi:hypothetical protein